MVHRLPDALTMQKGALVEPMAVSYHAVDRARLERQPLQWRGSRTDRARRSTRCRPRHTCLQHTEISITGSVAFVPSDFDEVMRLMAAGAYPTDGWVEHVPLAQVLTEGFEPLLAGRKTKVLIDLPLHV